MKRIETGVVQFDDDWPGIFIRGDNAFVMALELEGKAGFDAEYTIKGLIELLRSCDVRNNPKPQIIRRTEDAEYVLNVDATWKAAQARLKEASVRACYCVCHSSSSSRPSCVHCRPEGWLDRPDPYCGVTARDIGLGKKEENGKDKK